jgi:uncharacterized protein (TIGR03503 family)
MPLIYAMDIMFMIKLNIKRLAICSAMLFTVFWNMPMMAAQQPPADLRLLIDVSGSMKKNDPQNLRGPAVRLLVGMMPENTHSGIWTFGQRVSPLVTVGRVDKDWRRKAHSAADKIHSRERYTDIEQALQKATRDWTKPDPRFRRNIILLTDGLVDISEDQSKNGASRRRIVEQLLARIVASGAKIHIIALSANSDHDLMERLSAATGGWYEQVDNAKNLDRIFLRLFEQSTTPDTLPLKGNRFTVDESVSDMTVLAFRNQAHESLGLIAPNGKRFTVRDLPTNVRWLRETNYDLVTVEQPSKGEWQLDAPEDPDNRVTVVTNLRLEVDPIPAHFTVADAPTVSARLQYDSTKPNRPDFLDWVRFSLYDTVQSSGEKSKIPFSDGGEPPDEEVENGTHSAELGDDLTPGLHELVVVADGGSFSREYRQMVNVYTDAVEVKIVPEDSDPSNSQGYRLDVRIEPALLNTESLQVRGYLESADAAGNPLDRIDHNTWRMELPASSSGDIVKLEIKGLGKNGKPYFFSQRLRIGDTVQQVGSQPETEKKNASVEDEQLPQTTPAQIDWRITAVYLFVGNLLLGLLVWLGYTLWKRQTADDEKPDTDSKTVQISEASNPQAPQSHPEIEADDAAQNQEGQPPAEQPGDTSNESEYKMSPRYDPASAVSPEVEQNPPQADTFSVENFDEELNATLEALEGESQVSPFSDDKPEADNILDDVVSAGEGAVNTTISVDDEIEKLLIAAQEDSQATLTVSGSTADAPSMNDAGVDTPTATTGDIEQGEARQRETEEQTEAKLPDVTESEPSDSDEQTLSADLSAGNEMMEESNSASKQAIAEEETNTSPDTKTEQVSEPIFDEHEQDLLDALKSAEEQLSDEDPNLQEEILDVSAEERNIEIGNSGVTGSEQASADDEPDGQQKESAEESQKMAR